jgi:sporulation integral membrane protein YlbJ
MSYEGVEIYARYLGPFLCKPLRLPIQCSFVIIISMLCGYPLGSKYASDIYDKKLISYNTYKRLLNIASNASPLFIIGSVGTSMLNNSYLGYLLFFSNIISCILMSLILPTIKEKKIDNYNFSNYLLSTKNFGSVIKSSVDSSITNTLSIGGFVVLFSVIISIVKNSNLITLFVNIISTLTSINNSVIKGLLFGIIEITNGCSIISQSNMNMLTKVSIIGFLIGFGGISIAFQVYSFIYKYKVPIKTYVFNKIIQGIFCSIVSVILFSIMRIKLYSGNVPAISYNTNPIFNKYYTIYLIAAIPLVLTLLKSLTSFIKNYLL